MDLAPARLPDANGVKLYISYDVPRVAFRHTLTHSLSRRHPHDNAITILDLTKMANLFLENVSACP